MRKYRFLPGPWFFVATIMAGFALNVFNEQLGYPFPEWVGWVMILASIPLYITEGILRGRFK